MESRTEELREVLDNLGYTGCMIEGPEEEKEEGEPEYLVKAYFHFVSKGVGRKVEEQGKIYMEGSFEEVVQEAKDHMNDLTKGYAIKRK